MIEQEEIVLLSYPFSNLKEGKIRPAIVVSNNDFNKKGDDLILVPLTSVLKEEPYSFIIEQKDLFAGKLIKPSRIRIDQIFCVDKSLIIKKIGKIKEEILKQIKKEIDTLI